jgi:opacity protein-like surface antigen
MNEFTSGGTTMNRLLLTAGLALLLAAPVLSAQTTASDRNRQYLNHGEVGVYGDLFRVAPSGGTAVNYLGLGGRVGFNVGTYSAIEAEMNYDFEQNYVSTVSTSTGSTTTSTTITSKVRPITGLFGPKFQFGSSGPFRAFLEGKAGFIDFNVSNNAPSPNSFANAVPGIGGSGTHLALFPGGGVEFFGGPLGLRVEAGDEVWINNGANNNLRITFSPTFRF